MSDESPHGWLLAGGGDAAEVAGRYDDWADGYDDDLAAWSYLAPERVADIVMHLRPDATSVLDAGCGTGLAGRALRAAGFGGAIHGLDVSERSLRLAEHTGAYTTLTAADLQRPLAIEDASVDALVCVGVMTYLPDVEAAWREFARVVRPGGIVVVTQREDLWSSLQCEEVVETLRDEGRWDPLAVDGPEPYLPGNPDGMATIGVMYLAAEVAPDDATA